MDFSPSKFLFDDDLSTKIKNLSEENKLLYKITIPRKQPPQKFKTVINVEKSNLVPSQVVLFLGFIAVKMWAWCLERNMFLSALYVPGIMNKAAGLLSRPKLESTEWMLCPRIFKQIVYVYKMPVLDMFASTLNHQVPKYFSWILDPQAVGMDAFSVNWNKGLLYMFLPFSLIQKCLQEIIEYKATVLLIAQVWQSRSWYPMLLNLLYDRPLLLPHNPQIFKLPWSQTVHPLLLYIYYFSTVIDFSSARSTVVLLDTGTPGTSREIYSEDADGETRTHKPSVLAIELHSSKAIAGKELSLSSWCIASLYIYYFSTVIDFSSEKYSGSTGHRNS